MPSKTFVDSPDAKFVDQTAVRYGRTPSQIIGLTDKNGNPDRYYGTLLDIALANKFSLDDEDVTDMRIYKIVSYIASIGKAWKVKYKNDKPERRVDILKREAKKEMQKKMPNTVPAFEDLAKSWNIKNK